MAETRPFLNGRLSLSILAGLIIVAGWVMVMAGRVGRIEGQLEGSHAISNDVITVERRLGAIEASIAVISARIISIENRKITPDIVALRFNRIDKDLDRLRDLLVNLFSDLKLDGTSPYDNE